MNTAKVSRGIGMKYTRYLIYGNYYEYNAGDGKPKWVRGITSFFELVRVLYLLGFSSFLLPFALTIDTGRLFLYLEIKLFRRLKQISLIYRVRKNTISLVDYGSRWAYSLIRLKP
jgi:hypothetical protein